MDKKLFPMRIDELPVIGRFLYSSLGRDAGGFTPYIAFNDPFPDDYGTNLGLVEDAISPVVIIKQMKLVTFNLINNTYKVRDLINQAEIFFNSAGALLNVLPKDMGQSKVRVAVNRGDVEQLIGAMKTLNQNIFNNSGVLISQGFTIGMQKALVDLAANIKKDNDIQNTLYELRSSTAATNMVLFNGFWTTYMNATATTGKLIYKVADKTKTKDYTVSALIKRIRNDQKQTEIHGLVTNGLGELQNKAKVKLIPVDGGRTKTVYTDDKGLYSMNGMRATDYNLLVTSGVLVKVTAVTVVTRVHLEVNVVVG